MSASSSPFDPRDPSPQVLITRVFNASREAVFKAWTDPASLSRWYAPVGCAVRFLKLDVRTGGSYHSCISNPAFGECWCTGIYQEVTAPHRLVFTAVMANEKGEEISAAKAGHDARWPQQTTVTVTFTEEPGGKTKVTLHQTVSESLAKHTGAYPSWLQMLDRLETDVLNPHTAA